ncbi:PhzF family phenazine biosynthesis protein [Terrarubrum flagellatum]|uniref:PhzF family phenazine biosynthesis protein n=1 Tax=Terrirubrum flagellatum TaxID=2895980 RepID=UPI00314502F6
MKERSFVTLDVFTTQRFAGNPLAVVLDSDGLSDDAMQRITREFNFSETVFVQPARHEKERAYIRIFTRGRELQFAGHPTVGTAVLLGLRDRGAAEFILGEKVGPVPCVVHVDSDVAGAATFDLPRLPKQITAFDDRKAIADMLGLDASDIGFGPYAPALFDAGVPFPMIPIASRDAIDRIRLSTERRAQTTGSPGNDQLYVYCAEPVDAQHHFYTRMFAPAFGIPEDPATGSAVAAFAGAIMEFERPVDGVHRFVIEQGYAMGRPSDIELTLHVESGALMRATIGGDAIIVTRGVILA